MLGYIATALPQVAQRTRLLSTVTSAATSAWQLGHHIREFPWGIEMIVLGEKSSECSEIGFQERGLCSNRELTQERFLQGCDFAEPLTSGPDLFLRRRESLWKRTPTALDPDRLQGAVKPGNLDRFPHVPSVHIVLRRKD